jgi:TonB-linked outer membrane protein, SusC/RagA family
MRKLNKYLAMFAFGLLMINSSTLFAQNTKQSSDSTLIIFDFDVNVGNFLLETGKNADMQELLFKAIDTYRKDIASGKIPVYVNGYCNNFSTKKENRDTAYIRASHVKSDMILKKSLVEDNFITRLFAESYNGRNDVVTVVLKVKTEEVKQVVVAPEPKPEPKPAPEPTPEPKPELAQVIEEVTTEEVVQTVEETPTINKTAVAGKHTVTGRVINAATGAVIPGANIDVTRVASDITDNDGAYTLSFPETGAGMIMIVNAEGYGKQEISVRGRNTINIELYETSYKGASKNIVTPQGEKSDLSTVYSWFGIKEDNLASNAVTPDVLLKTQASGLNVITRSGMPASGSNFYLRGINTMHAGELPLFVVDGMPYENTYYSTSQIGNYFANPLTSIDPKDIESITILKDGTSLYGSKGANGVILIQTLRSKSLETTINARVNMGVGFIRSELPVLNSGEHKFLLSELYQKAYPGVPSNLINNEFPFLNQNKPVKQPWGYEGNTDYYRYNAYTNWQKEIYSPSWNQNYYVNVSGGDEIATYVLSLGYLKQEGMVTNTDFSRFNTRFNSEIKLSNNFKVLSNMSFVYGTKHLPNEGSNVYLNPILASLTKAEFTAPYIYNEEGKRSPNLEDADYWNLSNPYVLVNNKSNLVNINYRFFGSFEFIYNINRNLDVAALVGLNFNKEREKAFYPGVGVGFPSSIGGVSIFNQMQHRVDRLFSLYGDVYTNYHNNFNQKHFLNFRAGVRYQNNEANDNFGIAFNSSSDDFKSLQYGASALRGIGGNINDWTWLSLYANLDYSFLNKYIVNLHSAFDNSSRYGTNVAAFLPFPSLGAAWLVSNEDFMQNLDIINMLKIRASYGISGNDDIGNYNGDRYYHPYPLVGQFGLVRTSLVNPDLKPERMTRINGGIDLSMLKERLNISIDLYSNTVSDMILAVKAASISGSQNDVLMNAGKMRNIGFDFNLNTRIINDRHWKWDLGLMISKYKNEVLDLGGKEYYNEALGATIQSKEGQPLGMFYGYKTDGVYSTTADATAAGLNIREGLLLIPFMAGDMRFVNQDGNNVIDASDRVVIGDPNPDWFGNISTTVKYKQFALNAVFTYSLGGDVYNYSRTQLESMSTPYNQFRTTLNRWRQEGDVTNIPQATPNDPMGNARFSDRWIEDGSYLRLKNVTLSYDLKVKIPVLQSCAIYLTGENLLTLTKYKGVDPEFAYGVSPLYLGIDPCVMPQSRIVSLGVKLGL